MSEHEHFNYADAVGAVRLALAASADARTLRKVLTEILERTPVTSDYATRPVALFIDSIQAAKGTWQVTDEKPKGEIVRV